MTRSFYITIFSKSILKYSFKTFQVYICLHVCATCACREEDVNSESFSECEHELAPLAAGAPGWHPWHETHRQS